MRFSLVILLFFFSSKGVFCQVWTGEALLEKSIEYHDPNSAWSQFDSSFTVTMKSPNKPVRTSQIKLDLEHSFFEMNVKIEENQWKATLENDQCELRFNGSSEITPEVEKQYKLNCDRAFMYRDYYSYLYGLPMKLKDPGTRIAPEVEEKSIEGTTYWVLKVTYDPKVGSDTWYFYFDQDTFALKRYQFFHDESKNDGEYIILEEEIEIGGILMPKKRSWFYNSDDTFLGIDLLSH